MNYLSYRRITFGGQACVASTCSVGIFYNASMATPNTTVFFNDTNMWDHGLQQWSFNVGASSAAIPPSRSFHAAAVLFSSPSGSGKMYICGGQGWDPQNPNRVILFSDVWSFDPLYGLWTMLTQVPGLALGYPSVAPISTSSFLVFAGQLTPGNADFTGRVYKYTVDSTTGDLHLYNFTQTFVAGNGPVGEATFAFVGVSGAYNNGTLYTFGGQKAITYSEFTAAISLGCNVGDASAEFASVPCAPCPKGTFSGLAGAEVCDGKCPSGTSTAHLGATSLSSCTVCQIGYCHHGVCAIGFGGQPYCQCHFGYRGSTCTEPVFIIAFTVSLAAICLAVVIFLLFRKLVRVYMGLLHQGKNEIALRERLLEDLDEQMDGLERGMRIEFRDIKMQRLIGKGTYGEVMIGFSFSFHFYFTFEKQKQQHQLLHSVQTSTILKSFCFSPFGIDRSLWQNIEHTMSQ